MIDFDHNATTPLDPRVAEAIATCWASGPLNASSQHRLGRRARFLLDDAISRIGRVLGADLDSPGGDQLILTSGGTESNNLALLGIGEPAGRLVISQIEHPSIVAAAAAQASRGRPVASIPVSSDGRIDLARAEEIIQLAGSQPSLVSVMAANNETGVIQPIEELARLCSRAAVPLHVDATQVVGKLPFSFSQSGIAALTFTAHKFHGPAGIGGLLLRAGLELRPLLIGGEQQLGHRGGTEPVALAVGMALALELAIAEAIPAADRIAGLRDRLEQSLSQRLGDQVVIHGESSARLPGTTCLSLRGTDRQAMLMALDLNAIACSSGSACASGSSRPSHVLTAMNVPPSLVESAIRFGLSRFSTTEEVDRAVDIISLCHSRLRKKESVEKPALYTGIDR